MTKRIAAVLLVLASLPGPARAETKLSSSEAFVLLMRHPWRTLDPALADDIASYLVTGNVYEALLTFGKGPDDLKPFLSEEVPTPANGLVSPNGLSYSFPIRKGVRFHDGSMMTPEDVRYSFLREMLHETKGGSSSMLLWPLLGIHSTRDSEGRWAVDPGAVDRALRVEGDKLVFRLAHPLPGFLKLIAAWPIITSKAWAVSHGDWDGVVPKPGGKPPEAGEYLRTHADGTGAFKVESADPATGQLVLLRHDGYWGKRAKLRGVVLRSEPMDALRALKLRSGEADYAYLERPSLELLQGEPGVKIRDGIKTVSSGETIFFNFNIDAASNPYIGSGKLDGAGIPPDFFSDRDVRVGFEYSFDPDWYLAGALGGKGTRASGPIPDTLLPAGPTNPYRFDRKKAEAAFKKAFGGKLWETGFTARIGFPRGSYRRQLACEVLKAGVESINLRFKLHIHALGPEEYNSAYESRRLPLFVQGYAADYPDAHAIAFQFFHSNGYFAKAQGLSRPEFDKMVENASIELDPAKRAFLYSALERDALGNAVQIYTAHPLQFQAVRALVQGFDDDPNVGGLGFVDLPYFRTLSKQ